MKIKAKATTTLTSRIQHAKKADKALKALLNALSIIEFTTEEGANKVSCTSVQRSTKWCTQGLVEFVLGVPAVAGSFLTV